LWLVIKLKGLKEQLSDLSHIRLLITGIFRRLNICSFPLLPKLHHREVIDYKVLVETSVNRVWERGKKEKTVHQSSASDDRDVFAWFVFEQIKDG
jgi:hypothetical protein